MQWIRYADRGYDGVASGGGTAEGESDAGEILIWIAGIVLVGVSISIAVVGWF